MSRMKHGDFPPKSLIFLIFDAFIAIVAAGVLPVEVTMDQPLNVVAVEIFLQPVYLFFVIAGALLALSTTLNASFAGLQNQSCRLVTMVGYQRS